MTEKRQGLCRQKEPRCGSPHEKPIMFPGPPFGKCFVGFGATLQSNASVEPGKEVTGIIEFRLIGEPSFDGGACRATKCPRAIRRSLIPQKLHIR
jgi:hypothetical protein